MVMRIVDQIRDRASYTPTESAIAAYVGEHARDVVNLSLEQLAERLFVSKSTVIRFCKKLGYKGHKEFTVELARELDTFMLHDEEMDPSNPYTEKDDARSIAEKTFALHKAALTETWQEMDWDAMESIAILLHDKPCTIYAVREMYLNALNFAGQLKDLGLNCDVVRMPGGTRQEALRQKPGSIALFLSYREAETELVDGARILKDRGIPLYLITGPLKGPLGRYADQTIRLSYYEPEPKQVACGSRTAVLLVLDILYGIIFRMDYDENTARISQAYNENLKYAERRDG
jgi:RpiR family carbohydrate utilization transcriptional regulator